MSLSHTHMISDHMSSEYHTDFVIPVGFLTVCDVSVFLCCVCVCCSYRSDGTKKEPLKICSMVSPDLITLIVCVCVVSHVCVCVIRAGVWRVIICG